MYGGLRDYEEKRNYYRMSLGCPLIYATTSGESRRAVCVNLSTRGMLIETDRYYPVGTQLKVHLQPSLDISPPLDAVFEVVRIETTPDERRFLIGGVFEPVAEPA